MKNINEIYKKILGDKKVGVIEFLFENRDKNGFVTLTIDEICTQKGNEKVGFFFSFKPLNLC